MLPSDPSLREVWGRAPRTAHRKPPDELTLPAARLMGEAADRYRVAWSSPPVTLRCATTRERAAATRAGPRPTAQSCCPTCTQVGPATPGLSCLHGLIGSPAGPVLPQTTWAGPRGPPRALRSFRHCQRCRYAASARLSDPTAATWAPREIGKRRVLEGEHSRGDRTPASLLGPRPPSECGSLRAPHAHKHLLQ